MKLGNEMLRHCGGLPLAIVVLGGLLATKHTMSEWEMVNKNISYYLGKGKGDGGVPVKEVLALSYQDLPYHLKACFLYFSHLPEGYGISPQQLVQMWMAEGIVSSSSILARAGEVEEETMLDVGMSYLGELIHRCMVQVQWTRFSKRFKMCGLHDLMRDMCLLKAQEENFVKVVSVEAFDGQLMCADCSSSPSLTTTRRLTMYYLGKRRSATNPILGHGITNSHNIRSFQFFFGDDLESSSWLQIKSLFKGFKRLKVLDIEGIMYGGKMMLPRAIGNLIHLRYLNVRDSGCVELPSSIGNLRFLQTLDLRAGALKIIPNVIWKLEQLRHLLLPRSEKICVTPSSEGKLRLDTLSKLETLEFLDSRYCDVGCFPKLKNLRKLGIYCYGFEDLDVILKSSILNTPNQLLRDSDFWICGDFRTEEEQSLLRQLLGCQHFYKLALDGSLNQVQKLPDQFPPNLTKLTLWRSELVEDPMPTLEKLANLRFLWLNKSYVGKEMVCSDAPTLITPSRSISRSGEGVFCGFDGGFPQLKFLRFFYLGNLEKWRVEEGAMPNLEILEIRSCPKLKKIPEGLRSITTLKELEISYVSQALKDRVLQGGEDFYKVQHVPSLIIR